MAEPFLLEDSLVTFITQTNLICASYAGVIVFGKVKNKHFVSQESFRFFRSQYHLIFLTFVQIAKVFSGLTPLTKKKIMDAGIHTYNWEVTQQGELFRVTFTIEQEVNQLYKVCFNPNQLNNFCMTIKELILPSLCLKYTESELLRTVSLSNVIQIKRFKIKEECYNYVKNYFKKNEYLYEAGAILLHYYRDIIMLLHKLDQFYSDKDEDDIVKLICGDIS